MSNCSRMLEEPRRLDIRFRQPSVVERGRYQCTLTSDIRKLFQVVQPSDSTAREYMTFASDQPDSFEHLKIGPGVSADPSNVKHDDCLRAGIDGLAREFFR